MNGALDGSPVKRAVGSLNRCDCFGRVARIDCQASRLHSGAGVGANGLITDLLALTASDPFDG
jgi:hypothetical protein